MRYLLIAMISLMTILMSGCGERVDTDSVDYDIANNPDNFPPRAIELLQKLESRELAVYDLIVNSFGELYLVHPELLENNKWSRVVRHLGGKFQYDAESLSQRGVPFYLQAAGYFKLASFARPDDEQLASVSRLFETWTRGIHNLAALGQPMNDFENLDEAVRIVRYFSLGDSLQQAFASEYLIDPYLEKLIGKIEQRSLTLKSLTPVNQAFLAFLGMYGDQPPEPLAQSTLAKFAYMGGELVPITSNAIRAEIFLFVRDTTNLEISMSLHMIGLQPPVNDAKSFDIVWLSPDKSKWQSGSIVAGTVNFLGVTSVSGAEFQIGDQSSGDSETFVIDVSGSTGK